MNIIGKTKRRIAAERDEARAMLDHIKPGTRIYTVNRSVAASGMSAVISAFHITDDGRLAVISPQRIAQLTGYPMADAGGRRGNRVYAGGTDRGFELVYRLGQALFPKGTDNGAHNATEDGGYALKQEWI